MKVAHEEETRLGIVPDDRQGLHALALICAIKTHCAFHPFSMNVVSFQEGQDERPSSLRPSSTLHDRDVFL